MSANNKVKIGDTEFYLPEAGELYLANGRPMVALRCTAPKVSPRQVNVEVPNTMAADLKHTIEGFVAQGYEQRDFCLAGELGWNEHGRLCFKHVESLRMQFRCRVSVERVERFVQGQGILIEEIVLFSMERDIFHFSQTEVYFYGRDGIKVVGTPQQFVSEAKLALREEKDFIFGQRFVWQRRDDRSKMANNVINDVTRLCGISAPKLVL